MRVSSADEHASGGLETIRMPMGGDGSSYPWVGLEEIYAVLRVLNNGTLTGNKKKEKEIRQFEEAYAKFAGVKHCVAMQSGTAALHSCMAAVGIQPGDEVIVPTLAPPASAFAVLHHQGVPVFADVDPITWHVSVDSITPVITERTRAVLVSHVFGLPLDVGPIKLLCKARGLNLIEEFSHAHGASYQGRLAGTCADVAAASIRADKIVATCGEGGVLITNDDELRNKAERIRMFGEIIVDDERRTYAADTLGWNYRISPIQAAFANAQLQRHPTYQKLRRSSAAILTAGLKDVRGLRLASPPPGVTHGYHAYTVRVEPSDLNLSSSSADFRAAVMDALGPERIPQPFETTLPGYAVFRSGRGYGGGCPWTCHPNRSLAYREKDYKGALEALDATIVIARGSVELLHPNRCIQIVDQVKNAVENANTA